MPCPWLPALAHTAPAARSAGSSWDSRLYAPRSLYDRPSWRSSRLSHTWAPVASDSRSFCSNGVMRATPDSRSLTAAHSAANDEEVGGATGRSCLVRLDPPLLGRVGALR